MAWKFYKNEVVTPIEAEGSEAEMREMFEQEWDRLMEVWFDEDSPSPIANLTLVDDEGKIIESGDFMG